MSSILLRLLPALLLIPLAAHGTIVTTATDEADGSLGGGAGVSLREAVKFSTAGTTITFASALSGQTIRLTRGEITISNSLTIDGSSLATRITLSGDKSGNGKTSDDTTVFRIGPGTIVLDSLIISGGHNAQGGGIISNIDTTNLTVKKCHFTGNSARVVGGAIFFSKSTGAGIPILTLTDSTFTGNSATNEGGAIYAIYPVQIQTSTFTGNTARDGGAVFLQASSGPTSAFRDTTFIGNSATADGGAIHLATGSILLERSTAAGNSATRNGGGIYSRGNAILLKSSTISRNAAQDSGGGIYTSNGNTDLENSTIAINSATSRGGGIFVLNSMVAQNCTIAANTAGIAGGGLAQGSANLRATIVSGNTAPFSPDVELRDVNTQGNLITPILSLAPLGNYGGPTQTMPPLTGSPAIDPSFAQFYSVPDQRGFPRNFPPDIGAVEYQGFWSDDASIIYDIMPLIWKLDADGDGLPYAVERLHGTNPFIPDSTDTANLSAPAMNGEGRPVLTFSVARETSLPNTHAIWKLMRSPDLTPGNFRQIYRYGSFGEVAVPGVTFDHASDPSNSQKERVTITDATPSQGSAFYRFEAVLAPNE